MRTWMLALLLSACTEPMSPPLTPQRATCTDCVAPPTHRCRDDAWHVTTLDSPGISGDNALAIVGDEVHALAVVVPAPGAAKELRHLWAPIGSDAWQQEVVVTSPERIDDFVITDAAGAVAIAYGLIEGDEEIEHILWRGRDGGWTDVRGPQRSPEGGNRTIAADQSGRVHLTYRAVDETLHFLSVGRDARMEDDPILEGVASSALVLDAEGRPQVAYLRGNGIVGHAARGEADWTIEDLAGGVDTWTEPTLAIDGAGTQRLGFVSNGYVAGVGYYRRTLGGPWRLGPAIVGQQPAWGFGVDFTSTGDRTYAIYSNPDSGMHLSRLDESDPGVDVGGVTIEFHLAADGWGGLHVLDQTFSGHHLQYAYRCR